MLYQNTSLYDILKKVLHMISNPKIVYAGRHDNVQIMGKNF